MRNHMLRASTLNARVPVSDVSFINASFSGSLSTTRSSYPQPVPSGLSGDDLFIIAGSNDQPGWNTPAGWALVAQNGSSGNRSAIFHKVSTADSEADVTVTRSTSKVLAGVCLRFRGVTGYAAGTMAIASSTSVVATEVTMPNSGLLLACFVSGASSRTWTQPDGFDTVFLENDATQPSFGVFSKLVFSGAKGGVMGVTSGASSVLNGLLIGLT